MAIRPQPTVARSTCRLTFAVFVFAAACWPASTSGEESDPRPSAGQKLFRERVEPILRKHCRECHSHASSSAEGGLVLDSRAGWQTGGESGPAIVPGKPDESLLVRAIEHRDEDLEMPPDGKLSAEEIRAIREWIRLGAPDPRVANATRIAAKDHWSFQSPVDTSAPRVERAEWPLESVDHFILAKLEAAGIEPAEEAERRTWLRRVTFDLSGLPPTPDELAAFLADDRPGAHERVVDRLLASPTFGERWARHWLDVARYADSNGGGVNVVHDDAWRYRDWVIRAFDGDMPYDRFVVAQLAGDLLPDLEGRRRVDAIVATTFLMLGPKPLAKYDKAELKLDIADEQLDTIGKAFLGLSIGCARCHDHKFDPIEMRDYYGLAGIFTSTRSLQDKQSGPISTANVVPIPVDHKTEPWHGYLEKRKPSALAVSELKPRDEAIRRRGSSGAKGAVVPRGTIAALGPPIEIPSAQSGRLQLARWIASERNPLVARVYVNRVWSNLFGEGLVTTENDFGTRGRPPSHQELLDHLATQFVREGWSTKRLVRRLVLSRTYRQSSRPASETARRLDPDNRLLGRMNARRLDTEALRDAMLVAAGRLDRRRWGPAVPWSGRLNAGKQTKTLKLPLALDRRAVYLPVIRDGMTMVDTMDMFATFDFADPSLVVGDRNPTTVPTQALYLLNSPFVGDLAAATVDRVSAETTDEAERIRMIFESLLGRLPADDEVAAALAYVADFPSEKENDGWVSLCRSLFSCNEFLFTR